MTLSLDTNVFIQLLRGRDDTVRTRFVDALAAGQSLKTPLIVLHELLYGAELCARPDAEREAVRLLLDCTEITAFDARDMVAAARLRFAMKTAGRSMGAYDLLIAGQALARRWTIVSGEARAFAAVDGLDVIDWTAPAG